MNGVVIRDKRRGNQEVGGFFSVVKLDTKRDGVLLAASGDTTPPVREVKTFEMQVDEGELGSPAHSALQAPF